jgi:hypothetical protein
MVMEDYPTFREFYDKEIINTDHRDFMDYIPKKKQHEIHILLKENKIPVNYHFYFYAFYQIISSDNPSSKNDSRKEMNETFEFFEIVKDLSVKEIIISATGKDQISGESKKGRVVLKINNPFFKNIEALLKDVGKQNEMVLKTYSILNKQSRRGAKPKSRTHMLKWFIPEADQLLSEFGMDATQTRSNFLGKFLVIAGILEPEPPFSYKSRNDYYHSRIKQYKS